MLRRLPVLAIFLLILSSAFAQQPVELDGQPVYKVGGSVLPPRAIETPDPKYPKQARAHRVQGVVTLWLIVDTNGMPREIKVTKSLEHDLDLAAAAAVNQWRFSPATKDGHPVYVMIYVEVNFHLY